MSDAVPRGPYERLLCSVIAPGNESHIWPFWSALQFWVIEDETAVPCWVAQSRSCSFRSTSWLTTCTRSSHNAALRQTPRLTHLLTKTRTGFSALREGRSHFSNTVCLKKPQDCLRPAGGHKLPFFFLLLLSCTNQLLFDGHHKLCTHKSCQKSVLAVCADPLLTACVFISQRSHCAPTTMRSTSTRRMGPSGARSMSWKSTMGKWQVRQLMWISAVFNGNSAFPACSSCYCLCEILGSQERI